jgi:hypothetical protein
MWKTFNRISLSAFLKFGYENEGTRTISLKVSFSAGFGVGVVFLEGDPPLNTPLMRPVKRSSLELTNKQQPNRNQQDTYHSPLTTMSIVSGTRAVKLTDDVRSAVVAVSRRYDFGSSTCTSDSTSTSPIVPFCILKFVAGTESTLTVDTLATLPEGDLPATWDSLVASLPRDQCRMVLAQVPWRAHSDGVVRTRPIFILWAPQDGPSVKERMVASMFAKGAKGLIDQWGAGMSLPVQAATIADLQLVDVEDKIRAKATVKLSSRRSHLTCT